MSKCYKDCPSMISLNALHYCDKPKHFSFIAGGSIPQLQAQLMMGIRAPSGPPPTQAPPPSINKFQNAIQRPNMMLPPPSTRPTRPPLQQSQQGGAGGSQDRSKSSHFSQPLSSTPASSSSTSTSSTSSGGSGRSAAFHAQQAKQRAELLAHAQSFLNPAKKPAPKVGEETGPAKDADSTKSADDSAPKTEDKKAET